MIPHESLLNPALWFVWSLSTECALLFFFCLVIYAGVSRLTRGFQ
jgi:hypothetical protein